MKTTLEQTDLWRQTPSEYQALEFKELNESRMWKTVLETCLKNATGKATPGWTTKGFGEMTLQQIQSDYPYYAAVCNTIIA